VSTPVRFPQVKKLATPDEIRGRADELNVALSFDDDVAADGPLSTTYEVSDASTGRRTVGNRFAILPMEGWDATTDGAPTDLVERRWRRFGEGGAKLIWGEATAVVSEGRANPRQLVMAPATAEAIGALRASMVGAHRERFGTTDDLVVGLQLTHSGRWCRPLGALTPLVAYEHPLLANRSPGAVVLSDAELFALIDRYVDAAVLAESCGFDFVDVKHCHGYLLHELLSAYDRPGPFGGSFENRTRFFRLVVEGIRARAPGLSVALRLSVFDFGPFAAGDERVGVPEFSDSYRYAFGGDGTGSGIDLTEAHAVMDLCRELGIGLVSVTAGSPYYNPHIQRPAYFPPSDGYLPPEDPLVGVARMLDATGQLQVAHPDLAIVAGGMSYLQDWIAHAGQALVREGATTAIGLGRMALSYPDLPADVLAGRPLQRQRVCRTLSDCTTAPRHGLVSGCYPLDDYYKERPERAELATIKRSLRSPDTL